MSTLELLAAYLGRTVWIPGGLGGQCVDWANLYLINVPKIAVIRANAVDWAGLNLPGFRWTVNTATNAPTIGSLVVWREAKQVGVGPFGHIAIALAADAMSLLSCDQDWPFGAPVSIVLHTYAGVVGWHKPI